MKRRIQLLSKGLFIPVFIIGCNNSNTKKTDLSTQANYEKYLTDLGV